MSVIETLKRLRRGKTGVQEFCLRTIRFRKLLENARFLLDLVEDAKEKALGEYILDRHYVTTLMDNVVERLGMMVYDACVLVPEKSEELFLNYDAQVLIARKLIGGEAPFVKSENQRTGAQDTPNPAEPEYRLLADVLKWMSGKELSPAISVMDFMKQAFFHAIQGIDAADRAALLPAGSFKATDGPFYLVDLWKDAIVLPATPRSIHEIDCIPLKQLLLDTCGERSQPDRKDDRDAVTWIAATSEHQLSLSSFKPGVRLRMETTASGYKESDFIFMFADTAVKLDSLLPAGFHIEKTDYGQLAWNIGASSKTIEDSLMVIGRTLFNESVWRT